MYKTHNLLKQEYIYSKEYIIPMSDLCIDTYLYNKQSARSTFVDDKLLSCRYRFDVKLFFFNATKLVYREKFAWRTFEIAKNNYYN